MNKDMVETAYKTGARIEYCYYGTWNSITKPGWHWDCFEYRIIGALEVEDAFNLGAKIEVRVRNKNKETYWFYTEEPNWDWDRQEYRVKAEANSPEAIKTAFINGSDIKCRLIASGCDYWKVTFNHVWDFKHFEYQVIEEDRKEINLVVEKQVYIGGHWYDLSSLEIRDKLTINTVYLNIHEDGSHNSYDTYIDAKANCNYPSSEVGVEFVRAGVK